MKDMNLKTALGLLSAHSRSLGFWYIGIPQVLLIKEVAGIRYCIMAPNKKKNVGVFGALSQIAFFHVN